jgi:hypothetical protein
MPAIQPARLKDETARLAALFARPEQLRRGLYDLFEFYADRAYRPGQTGDTPVLLPAYNIRPPVMRQLLQTFSPLAAAYPEDGLIACDALWAEPVLEFRLLAAGLLGQVQPEPIEAITGRVEAWLPGIADESLRTAVLDGGLTRLRGERPQALLDWIGRRLSEEANLSRQSGLRALLPLVQSSEFQNFPQVFRLMQPLVRSAPPALRPEVLEAIAVLARRSPPETAYFLRQTLEIPLSPDATWFLRQSLNEFPESLRNGLRQALRQALRR